ncbi:hypothetical protein QJS10_CPA02g00919 [Acorus calamus]|nr:hypothetical protein QJS10_CPA02g00919 [Acorus calamus]
MSGRRRRWWSKEKKKIMVYPSRRCAVKEMVVMVGVCVWCHCEPNTFPSPPHLLGQWGVEVEHPSSVVRASRVSASGWQVWGYQ